MKRRCQGCRQPIGPHQSPQAVFCDLCAQMRSIAHMQHLLKLEPFVSTNLQPEPTPDCTIQTQSHDLGCEPELERLRRLPGVLTHSDDR